MSRRSLRLSYRLSPLLLAMLLGACAGSPAASPEEDRQAKQFPAPAAEKGALYVFRDGGLMGVVKTVDVSIAGGAEAVLAANNYLRLEGPPGPIDVTCRTDTDRAARHVDIAEGQTRYLQITMTPGLWGSGCSLAEVGPDRGQAAIRGGKQVVAK